MGKYGVWGNLIIIYFGEAEVALLLRSRKRGIITQLISVTSGERKSQTAIFDSRREVYEVIDDNVDQCWLKAAIVMIIDAAFELRGGGYGVVSRD
jgi:hypothetical protein